MFGTEGFAVIFEFQRPFCFSCSSANMKANITGSQDCWPILQEEIDFRQLQLDRAGAFPLGCYTGIKVTCLIPCFQWSPLIPSPHNNYEIWKFVTTTIAKLDNKSSSKNLSRPSLSITQISGDHSQNAFRSWQSSLRQVSIHHLQKAGQQQGHEGKQIGSNGQQADTETWSRTEVLTCYLLRGRHLSYQRGKRNTNPGTSLIKIEGVDDTAAAKYVLDIELRDGWMY